tara:strand:+ start:1134 stop:1514 length:381 start_codon:yes stop_codon:yes gene_type:complete
MTTFVKHLAEEVAEAIEGEAGLGWYAVLNSLNDLDLSTPQGIPLKVVTVAAQPSINPVQWKDEPPPGWDYVLANDLPWMRVIEADGTHHLLRLDAPVEWFAPLAGIKYVLEDQLQTALDDAGIVID